MLELDSENKLSDDCSKNTSFCEDSVKFSQPTVVNVKTHETDEDSILMGNDATTIKSLEYSQTSFNNSSQIIEEKPPKRKSSKLSLTYVGTLFNKLVFKVSNANPSASYLNSKKYEAPSLEDLELKPLIEQLLSQRAMPPNHVAGVTGLFNQGNTCYMNAILQCLSNADQLTSYFLSDHYRTCLKLNQSGRSCGRFSNISTFTHSTTTLNSGSEHICGQESGKKSFSRSRGLVTEHLACLVRSMWSGRPCIEPLSRFKTLVGRMGKQFKGSSQQDAHEFLLWLLDQLNEDLSVNLDAIKNKSSKNNSGMKGNTSLEDSSATGSISPSSLPNQTSHSPINDLFQAYYRSSLTCLKCGHKSHTFDPFLSISLSIMSSSSLSAGLKHPIYVVVVYLSATPKQVRIGLQMKHGCTIKDLRDTISNDTNIPGEQLVLADVRMDGHVTTLFENQPIENFRNLSSIYAIEIPKTNQVENHIVMVIVNKFENGVQHEKFGDPVVLLMHDSCSFFDMQQDLFMEIKQHILVGLNNYFFSKSFLDLRLINFEDRSQCYYMSCDSFPLRSSAVNKALERCSSGPRHIVVIAEWYQMVRDDFSQSMNDSCVEHESVNVIRSVQYSSSCSLEDCFHNYTQKEQLGADNAWYCPSCSKKQVETLKTLTLWSLPKILVIHLKRFKHDSSQRSKLDTFVTFPTRDLDLSNYLSKTSKNIPNHKQVNNQSTNNQSINNQSTSNDKKETLASKANTNVQEASNVSCQQNFQCSFETVSKSKKDEVVSDCPPVVMKCIPNDEAISIFVSDHIDEFRRSSNGSIQNEVNTKDLNVGHSPSINNLQACKDSCNVSQSSLKDSQNICAAWKSELYDLYAVCNHYGSLYDGHYVACCMNPLTNDWYLFNDTQVKPIKEEEVVTKHAYLLFYKKKTMQTSRQPSCALITDKEKIDESADILKDEGKDDIMQAPDPKLRPTILSRIRSSLLRKSRSHPRVHLETNISKNEEKEFMISHSTNSDKKVNNEENNMSTSEVNKNSSKTRRNKSCKRKRHMLDCTRFCVLSSNESVICSDIQLAQLHSLQESRV